MRVLRELDNTSSIISLLSSLEAGDISNPSLISIEDRSRLLDFPDVSEQEKNIKSTSGLTKKEFLSRAVETPAKLTEDEIELLEDRYWLDVSDEETETRIGVSCGLFAIAPGVYEQFMEHLETLRDPFYEENEVKAFKSAKIEEARRSRNWVQSQPLSDRKRNLVEDALQYAHPWIRRLWEEDGEHRLWGFAVYENPNWAYKDEERDDCRKRQEHVLARGQSATGYEGLLLRNWNWEDLEWPAGLHHDLQVEENTSADDEEQFPKTINGLREHFNSIRAQPTTDKFIEKYVDPGDPNRKWSRLSDGTLNNVFLYVDQNVADSMYSSGWIMSPSKPRVFKKGYSSLTSAGERYPNVDDMWIWAIDPDYKPNFPSPSGYKGCLKVRLQQLVHNFYVARRWHADEFSLEDLWEYSQRSPNGAFVSFKDGEMESFAPSRDTEIGSAIKVKPPTPGPI
ncbi:hypothetical protein N7456_010432 [Penicillium angulare]|uniref:Uncharacterized protein n=1 Tax=Penicillium angulare TaxID=116970 RepID=A0A9W9F6S5_9EURO|nr:hypothetical protein N7456_010432 [Penicillium angulare]